MAEGISAIVTGAPITATGGLCFADPALAQFPDDADTALGNSWIKGGFIGEDGVTRTTDASDDKIRAWGGDTVKIVRTEHSITYTFQFLEAANAEVLKLIHGAENVIITAPTTSTRGKIEIRQTSKIPPRRAFCLDMKDDETSLRELVKNGQLTTSGDAVFVHSDVIRYECVIECFPDDQNVKAISLMGTPKLPAGGSGE